VHLIQISLKQKEKLLIVTMSELERTFSKKFLDKCVFTLKEKTTGMHILNYLEHAFSNLNSTRNAANYSQSKFPVLTKTNFRNASKVIPNNPRLLPTNQQQIINTASSNGQLLPSTKWFIVEISMETRLPRQSALLLIKSTIAANTLWTHR